MDTPSPERLATLTTHKALPRRRVALDEHKEIAPTRSRRSYTSPATEERITSWIRDASPAVPTEQRSFLLPLTPPGDSQRQQSTMEQGTVKEEDQAEKSYYLSPSQELSAASGSATPINQTHQSPPTPELTPPKKQRERKRSPSPPLRRRKRTSLSPPPTSRQVSSKAESFRTAAEQLSSPSVQSPISQSPSPLGTATHDRQHSSIGLGIGMTGHAPTTPLGPRTSTLHRSGAYVLQNSPPEAPTRQVVDNDPVVAVEPHAVAALSRHSDLLVPSIAEDTLQGFSYINDDDTPYRERTFFDEHDSAIGQAGPASAHSISPLSEVFGMDIEPVDAIGQASKRVSQISSSSMPQSVEVIVIDTTPKQEHKLRHANKKASLRAASSSQGDSNRSSLRSSSDYKPRLHGMLGKQANATANSSMHSDSGISMVGSDHIMKRWSKLANTQIPRRQPSMTHSLQYTNGSNLSPATQRTGSRPATAPGGPGSPPELRRVKRRTISNASSNDRDSSGRTGRQLTLVRPPAIPKRTSSLGASTSRDASQRGSERPSVDLSDLHASNHARTVSQPLPQIHAPTRAQVTEIQPKHISQQSGGSNPPLTPVIMVSPTDPIDAPLSPMRAWTGATSDSSEQHMIMTRGNTPQRSSKDNAALMASRALLETPFSGHSVFSGTSGNYEVHEATAVNIYPHTNSSVLVVQQATPSTIDVPINPGVRPGAYRVTEVTSPTQSERAQQPESMHVKIEGPVESPESKSETFADSPTLPYDSPLRNPRAAPRAPASESGTMPSVHLIPPTPMDLPLPRRQHPTNGMAAIVNGPVSLVRRAWSSGGRTSGAAVARTSGSWLASGTKKATMGGIQKKRSRPMAKDNNLSPFWRPKKFWDDEDGGEVEEEANGPEQGSSMSSTVNGNSIRSRSGVAGDADEDYFSQPVRNTLGFPQSRLVVSGPASLVRRLSSIRRYRSLKRKKFPSSMQPARPLSPSSLKPGLRPSKSSLKQPSSISGQSSSRSPVRIVSPNPTAMARRRQSQRRSVRFDFNPMRGLGGSSAESPGWTTSGMKKRSEKRAQKKELKAEAKAAKRREKMKSIIGQPRLETVQE